MLITKHNIVTTYNISYSTIRKWEKLGVLSPFMPDMKLYYSEQVEFCIENYFKKTNKEILDYEKNRIEENED